MLKVFMIDVLDGKGEIPITVDAANFLRLAAFVREAKKLFHEREIAIYITKEGHKINE